MSDVKLKLLCVDDEPRILEGLERHFRRNFTVLTANSGAQGLDRLREHKDIAIILSDMRMPEMDGATFLRHARTLAPNAIRMLLTGHADVASAMSAINEGQIFRFLTKPCEPELLLGTVNEAVRQYELVTAERVLLHRTLLGSIKAIVDVMALANPAVAGRALRLKRRVSAAARHVDLKNRWQVEAAAMLSQLGRLALPDYLARKLATDYPLDEEDTERVNQAVTAANRVIAEIPRMDGVGRILELATSSRHKRGDDAELDRSAELLRMALDLDHLEGQGRRMDEAFKSMRAAQEYNEELLNALETTLQNSSSTAMLRQLTLDQLEPGMVLKEDVRNSRGVLVAPRGCEVSAGFLEHIRSFADDLEKPKIAVFTPNAPESND